MPPSGGDYLGENMNKTDALGREVSRYRERRLRAEIKRNKELVAKVGLVAAWDVINKGVKNGN